MAAGPKIITVALEPCWDITCKVPGLDWGEHKQLEHYGLQPAGKALNVSRALAWLGQTSTAAGLWGRQDIDDAVGALAPLKPRLKTSFTVVPGRTRQNITIIDTHTCREMHLRAPGRLTSAAALQKLGRDLSRMVTRNTICVFAGSMGSHEQLDGIIKIINTCHTRGAKIVVDTSGPALRKIVAMGNIWLIKPNVTELCELLGEQIPDSTMSLVKAGRKLLDRVQNILISRGTRGAVFVSDTDACRGRCCSRRKKLRSSTVGCGDYLLAGFLSCCNSRLDGSLALQNALKVATAKAWGLVDEVSFTKVARQIKIESRRLT